MYDILVPRITRQTQTLAINNQDFMQGGSMSPDSTIQFASGSPQNNFLWQPVAILQYMHYQKTCNWIKYA